jgi:hypothetical protein
MKLFIWMGSTLFGENVLISVLSGMLIVPLLRRHGEEKIFSLTPGLAARPRTAAPHTLYKQLS